MNPRLFEWKTGTDYFGTLGLPSYFTMVALGFVIGAVLFARWAQRNRVEPWLMLELVVWMAIWGVLGARALHLIADGHFWDYVNVCVDPSKVDWKIDERECRALRGAWDAAAAVCHPVEKNCFAWADLFAGGYAFYGGFVAAGLFAVRFIRKHAFPVGKIVDLGAWVLMLGLAWGRMGCALAGCCFGCRTDHPIGVVFPGGSPASRHHWEEGLLASYRFESLPVHWTQVYSSLAGLLIAAFAYFWLMPRKRFDGQVFCVASGMYAVFRFMIEFIRRDERGEFGGLTTSQIIALAFLGVCAYLWRVFSRRAKVARTEMGAWEERRGRAE